MVLTYSTASFQARKTVAEAIIWHMQQRCRSDEEIAVKIPLDWEWAQLESHLLIQEILKHFPNADYKKSSGKVHITIEFKKF